MSWQLVLDDSFVHANTSAGVAGSRTGVPTTPAVGDPAGWVDVAGGIAKIDTNQLLLVSSDSDFVNNDVYRTDVAGNPDLRLVVTVPPLLTSGHLALSLRRQAPGDKYFLEYQHSGDVFVYAIVGGTPNPTAIFGGQAINVAHWVEIDFAATGTAPTTLAVTVHDLGTDGSAYSLLFTSTVTDNTAPLLQASALGVAVNQYLTGSQQTVSRVRGYTLAPAPPTPPAATPRRGGPARGRRPLRKRLDFPTPARRKAQTT